MIILIKRLFSGLCLCLMLFSINASAKDMSDIAIEPYGDFCIYGEDNSELAEILGITENELQEYCNENSIEYFAVNGENTKQIRLTVVKNDFSESVINISRLSDDKISALIPDIIGIEGAKGEIISREGQKFIKTQLRSGDSGGEYILTQYTTVAARKCYILSFYTDVGEKTDYIKETFESYSSPNFIYTDADKADTVRYIVLAAMIIFAIVCVAVAVSIVIDIRKSKIE